MDPSQFESLPQTPPSCDGPLSHPSCSPGSQRAPGRNAVTCQRRLCVKWRELRGLWIPSGCPIGFSFWFLINKPKKAHTHTHTPYKQYKNDVQRSKYIQALHPVRLPCLQVGVMLVQAGLVVAQIRMGSLQVVQSGASDQRHRPHGGPFLVGISWGHQKATNHWREAKPVEHRPRHKTSPRNGKKTRTLPALSGASAT